MFLLEGWSIYCRKPEHNEDQESGRADGHVRKKHLLRLGGGSFLDASNNSLFSAGTEGQLNGMCTEEAVEKKQIPAKQECGKYKSGRMTATSAFWPCGGHVSLHDGQLSLHSSGRAITALRKRAGHGLNEFSWWDTFNLQPRSQARKDRSRANMFSVSHKFRAQVCLLNLGRKPGFDYLFVSNFIVGIPTSNSFLW